MACHKPCSWEDFQASSLLIGLRDHLLNRNLAICGLWEAVNVDELGWHHIVHDLASQTLTNGLSQFLFIFKVVGLCNHVADQIAGLMLLVLLIQLNPEAVQLDLKIHPTDDVADAVLIDKAFVTSAI